MVFSVPKKNKKNTKILGQKLDLYEMNGKRKSGVMCPTRKRRGNGSKKRQRMRTTEARKMVIVFQCGRVGLRVLDYPRRLFVLLL